MMFDLQHLATSFFVVMLAAFLKASFCSKLLTVKIVTISRLNPADRLLTSRIGNLLKR